MPQAATTLGTTSAGHEIVGLPWAAVAAKWPEHVRQALTQETSAQRIELPRWVLEPALKRGKLAFPWGELCKYIKPASASLASAMAADAVVEIPLAVAVPFFLARGQAAASKREVVVPSEVPDLFAAPATARVPIAAAPTAPAPAPASALIAPTPALLATAAPTPKPTIAAPAGGRTPPPTPGPAPGLEVVSVPWAAVVAKWPDHVQRALAQETSIQTIDLPLKLLEPAVKRGKLAFPWRELCKHACPPSASLVGAMAEDAVLEIPLAVAVPLFLARGKAAVKRQEVTVPQHVPDLFAAPAGERKRVSTPGEPAATVAAAATPPLAPAPKPALVPAPAPAPVPPRPTPASAPAPGATSTSGIQMPATTLGAMPAAPAAETVAVPWGAVVAKWPEHVRQALARETPAQTIDLPLSVFEPALKRGKLAFSWRELCKHVAPASVSLQGAMAEDAVLEIPLAVAVPLFLARGRTAAPRREVQVPRAVPDLFAAPAPREALLPVGAPAEPPSISAPTPAGPATVAPSPVQTPPIACEPQEFVDRVARLPGIEEVALASTDGLLVAARLSEKLDRDAVAAFLPRMFDEAFGNALPFQVSPSDRVCFVFPEMTLALLKVDGHLLAATSRSMNAMPLAQVAELARGATLGQHRRET